MGDYYGKLAVMWQGESESSCERFAGIVPTPTIPIFEFIIGRHHYMMWSSLDQLFVPLNCELLAHNTMCPDKLL
ncbi:hypothetical protein YC2023_028234 [Brassica napus]